MAEAVVGIAGKIVASLAPRVLEYAGKLWGVKDEVVALRDTVSMLQAVLNHAEEQYHLSPEIQVWVANLKEAFYDAQDVLEELNIEAMRRELRGQNEVIKEVKTFFSSSNQLAFKNKMSYKLRAVRRRIEAIKADKGFQLDERPERGWRRREGTHSFVSEGDIKGRDKDKEEVVKFLLDSDGQEKVSVLPIVGLGGLGKTALAQCVYNDERVNRHFNLKIWVCVSDDFNMTKILKTMIACAKKQEPTEVVIELLQNELRASIDGKRYLLILDDWWNEEPETWLKLKALLMGGAGGSKILITTRLPSVGKVTKTTALPHSLRGLSENASFELLMQRACRREEEIQDPEIITIGKEIAKKCSGVPLVVRTVGSLLFFKESKHEWSQFKDRELPSVCETERAIESVLRLSYNHLPSHLKQCFAFSSLFPKDYVMDKEVLINLWMAQGFIQEPSNISRHLEDIAHEYFMRLLWSNFFQDYQKDPLTNKDTCKMHDLMHDLACLAARTECRMAWDDTKPIHEKTRHISYHSTVNFMDKLPISFLKASTLRTFLSIAEWWSKGDTISEADLRQLIHSFKKLRILDLHCIGFKKMPMSISKLKHLTYLDLSHNRALRRLPNCITRLHNLQTLKLNGCEALEELPRSIRKLVSLRNLAIGGCGKLRFMPHGLGQLSSLHMLGRFILPKDKTLAKDYCGLGELNGLNDIRGSLRIENLGHERDPGAESRVANLGGKKSLESLELVWTNRERDDAEIVVRDETLLDGLRPHSNLMKLRILRYEGESFSRWMMESLVSSLPNLVEVRFYDCRRCKHLPPLGQLPHLKILKIEGMTELEYMEPNPSSPLTSSSFPRLSELVIYGCGKLKALPPTPHLEELALLGPNNKEVINHLLGLSMLRTLEIGEMELLECLPEECLKSLTSLESLSIFDCDGMTSLSRGMRHLSNLVRLYIRDYNQLDVCKDESGNILDFPALPRLRFVHFHYLPKLESLPPWLLQLTTLEHLFFDCCDNLNELPEQIEALHSLQRLGIWNCPSLTSLPEGMRRLTCLTCLEIHRCPELEKRCKKDTGKDWQKIAHIPEISF